MIVRGEEEPAVMLCKVVDAFFFGDVQRIDGEVRIEAEDGRTVETGDVEGTGDDRRSGGLAGCLSGWRLGLEIDANLRVFSNGDGCCHLRDAPSAGCVGGLGGVLAALSRCTTHRQEEDFASLAGDDSADLGERGVVENLCVALAGNPVENAVGV